MLPRRPAARRAVPELEATTADPVQVVVAAMEGHARPRPGGPGRRPDAAAPSRGRPAATARTCPPGEAFCDQCGMRLPRAAAGGAPARAVGSAGLLDPGDWTRLPGLRRAGLRLTGRAALAIPDDLRQIEPPAAMTAIREPDFSARSRCAEGCDFRAPLTEVVYRCPRCRRAARGGARPRRARRASAAEWKALFAARFRAAPGRFASGVWGKKEWVYPQLRRRERGLDGRGGQRRCLPLARSPGSSGSASSG